MENKKSQSLFENALKYIPGGVNSPVRACGSVGGDPLFIERADGPEIFDADGNSYIDYVGSWGPMILGHRHPAVIEALKSVLETGTSFGAPTVAESELAELVVELVPSVEKVRMVNSGTEATMSAIRLARGFTGRNVIIKFAGCYHGHVDSLLVQAGSGALTLGTPSSPGVPEGCTADTLVLPYNDAAALGEAFKEKGAELAAVILEPVCGNMGCVVPSKEFLQALRQLCNNNGTVLIFDEVMTGFRVALGGAQGLYQVTPDLSTFGKVIGGGMPVGAFGGRADVMAHIAPEGPVYQAGTLSGNPMAMAAGLANLSLLEEPGFYEQLSSRVEYLLNGLHKAAAEHGVALRSNHVGGMFGLFFTDADQVRCFADVMACDTNRFTEFFQSMLEQGIYLAPSAFEAGFVSSAHSEADIDATIAAARHAFATLSK